MSDTAATCALCPYEVAERICQKPTGKGPENCPTLHQAHFKREALTALKDPQTFEFARQASLQEASGYTNRDQGYARIRPIKPRIEETLEFARRMGYSRLGLVFCTGLRHEAAIVHHILETNGFDVVSVLCKVGRVSKSELNLGPEDHIDMQAADESMCNPILQAFILNHEQTELNILLGLCVGHDSLVLKHTQGMCTVLAVKDRILGHNPLAAVYTYNSYSRYLKNPI
ncbi:MAG: DUF1847 domain-containing protein [Desulfovermiculus sp.]|nr:DUF1847 domain-containing protein [Desulfovermiculus sp.]